MKVILFGGTSEGRILAGALQKSGILTDYYVTSAYGASLVETGPMLRVHVGRLDEQAMERLFAGERPDCVIDATHPYAVIASENIGIAAQKTDIRCVRLERELGFDSASLEDIRSRHTSSEERWHIVPDAEAAADWLDRTNGNVFLSCGSKELAVFSGIRNFTGRVFARVLPSRSALEMCESVGLCGRHIILMQGPFSEELNEAMFRDTACNILVTKNGGRAGGFPEKIHAAQKLGMDIVVIGAPQEHLPEGEKRLSLEQVMRILNL